MPIQLLKNIKLDTASHLGLPDENEVLYKPFPARGILGAYRYPCKNLKASQPLFNDGFPSLILMPNSSDDVVLTQKGNTIRLEAAWVCGGVIQDTYWEVPDGLEYIMVLRFNPASFYSLFDIDPLVFQSNPTCSFRDIVAEKWHSVIDEMYLRESFQERIRFLSEVFSSHPIEAHLPYSIQAAIEYIDQKKGNTTVTELSAKLGDRVNQKWLQRNFVKYLGISPKKYISLQRFIYAYGQSRSNNSAELFDVALRSGYYDYNHFFKDFKQYLGVAPSRYSWT